MSSSIVREQKTQKLVAFCKIPRTRAEMMEHIGVTNLQSFRTNYLIPMQEAGLIRKTEPDRPTWRYQKYISVEDAAP